MSILKSIYCGYCNPSKEMSTSDEELHLLCSIMDSRNELMEALEESPLLDEVEDMDENYRVLMDLKNADAFEQGFKFAIEILKSCR